MKPDAAPSSLPTCTSLAEIRALDRQSVRLIGIYYARALAQGGKKRVAEATHAVIGLRDGTEVLLEPNWSPASLRSQPEHGAFNNRRVAVEGRIHAHSPAPPEPVAYITGPCVSPVSNIEALPEESNV